LICLANPAHRISTLQRKYLAREEYTKLQIVNRNFIYGVSKYKKSREIH